MAILPNWQLIHGGFGKLLKDVADTFSFGKIISFASRIPATSISNSNKIASDFIEPTVDKTFLICAFGNTVIDHKEDPFLSMVRKTEGKKHVLNGIRSGSISNYCQFAINQRAPLTNVVLFNPLTGDSLDDFNLPSKVKKLYDPHLAHLVGKGGLIIVASAPGVCAKTPSRDSKSNVSEYLEQAAVRLGSLNFPGIVKNGDSLKLYNLFAERKYGNYGRYLASCANQHGRRMRKLSNRFNMVRVLRSRLRTIRYDYHKLANDDVWQSAQNRSISALTKPAEQTIIQELSAFENIATHDKAARNEASKDSILEQTTETKINAATLTKKIRDLLTPQIETINLNALSDHVITATNQDPEVVALTQRIDSQLESFEKLPDAERLVSLKTLLEQLQDEHKSLFEKLVKVSKFTEPTDTQYQNRKTVFFQRIIKKLNLKDITFDFWAVKDKFVTEEPEGIPLYGLPQKGENSKSGSKLSEKKKAEKDINTKKLIEIPFEPIDIFAESFDDLFRGSNVAELRKLIANFNSNCRYLETTENLPELPDLGDIPEVPISVFEAPSIGINHKLSPRFYGTGGFFITADSLYRIYNPTLGRDSDINRALLERPVIIARGAEYIRENLGSLGYRVNISPEIANIIALRKEASDLNSLPCYPVEPHDAMAYFDDADYVACATLHNPNGQPVWIAGKTYHVKPAWDRNIITVNEEDLVTERIRPDSNAQENRITHTTALDVGLTFWTVTSEIGTIRISEDGLREDSEIKFSARTFTGMLQSNIEIAEAQSNRMRDLARLRNQSQLSIVVSSQDLSEDDHDILAALQIHTSLANRFTPETDEVEEPDQTLVCWPSWTPSLEDFIEVFPPPTPPSVLSLYGDKVKELMNKTLKRFGPRYSIAGTTVVVPPQSTTERAFELWKQDQMRRASV